MMRSLGSASSEVTLLAPSDFRSVRCAAWRDLLKRFVVEESAQDLIEYALLAAAVATAGMLALNAIGPTVGVTYNSWIDSSSGTPALWQPAEPWTSAGS